MKISGTMDAKVITKKEMAGVKDPTKTYYTLGVQQGDELGELSVTEEVFKATDKDKSYLFSYSYNTDFKSFQLVNATPVGK